MGVFSTIMPWSNEDESLMIVEKEEFGERDRYKCPVLSFFCEIIMAEN